MSFLASSEVIALYTDRAEEYAAIQRQASQQAIGLLSNGSSNQAQQTTRASRSIVLELVQNNLILDSVVFDIAVASSDGFAQRVSYGFSARQTIHHTPAGYYTDEFGMAPGEVDIDAEVIFSQSGGAAVIGQFVKILTNAKSNSPLTAPSVPLQLKMHDVYAGRSFIITQRELQIEQNVQMLNRARLRIVGSILSDYSSNVNSPKTQPASSTTNSLTAALTGALSNPPQTA